MTAVGLFAGRGDVILSMDNTEVTDSKQFMGLAAKAEKARAVSVLVRRFLSKTAPPPTIKCSVSRNWRRASASICYRAWVLRKKRQCCACRT